MSPHSNLLFLGTHEDKSSTKDGGDGLSYLRILKSCTGSAHVSFLLNPVQTWYELKQYCTKRNITAIITTSSWLLGKLLDDRPGSIDNYAGSLFTKDGLEIVILRPLKQLVTVPYGKFIATRYISKLTQPNKWLATPVFNWTILTPSNIEVEYNEALNASLCAVDIETYKENLAIRCIGFTWLTLVDGVYKSRSVVLALDSEWALEWCKKFCDTPAAKILQNGKYDISYLLRYGVRLYNYVWDTATLMHAWYSELPKDLASLSAFFVRESMYWKDLAETNDLETYYLYNAKDTHQTACVLLAWIREAPQWAWNNYKIEFPLLFPCILAEGTGLARDATRLQEQRTKILGRINEKLTRLRKMLGSPNFNPNSPVQVKSLLTILGCKDIESTNEKDLDTAMFRHPLNSLLLGLILDIRGDRKLISTYLRTDEDGKIVHKGTDKERLDNGTNDFRGRILYALNPHGTDTARLASKEHHFWTGMQIQNFPRGPDVKCTVRSDEGFLFGECDSEQAETRDTAHIVGEVALISAVNSDKDFHSLNASAMSGRPYEELFNDVTRKKLDPEFRDMFKRVNHGANYFMGWYMLIKTMGEKNIWRAQKLLQLPKGWGLREISEYLLGRFDKTYPKIRGSLKFDGAYPSWIKNQVRLHNKLVSATGWTRWCFGDPSKSNEYLKSLAAHSPSNLNAQRLNKAWMKVFYEIALPNPTDFKLCAQIHDSILFQYRIGREDLAHRVKEAMEIELIVTDIGGITRKYTVPAALKLGKQYWSELE